MTILLSDKRDVAKPRGKNWGTQLKFVLLLLTLSILLSHALPSTIGTIELPVQSGKTQSIPTQTDDGLDPITLIWTGYAPASWVAANFIGWSDSAYCSGPKSVNQASYNYTLEKVDRGGIACLGPRDHVRIWDMGTDPIFGTWSIGSAHHERTFCNPNCHHVVDSWGQPKLDVKAAFNGGNATVSISNFTLQNSKSFQGVMNDGQALLIQLKAPGARTYPVVFNEIGLSNNTGWSVTINGATISSTHPDITFWEPNGTYNFVVVIPNGYEATPSIGTINVTVDGTSQSISFKPVWSTVSAAVYYAGRPESIVFAGNATVDISSVQLTSSGNTMLRFIATEIGSQGALNITFPISIIPSGATVKIAVDHAQGSVGRTAGDGQNSYVYLTLPYGSHFVQLEFERASIFSLDYAVLIALAAAVPISVFLVLRTKRIRNRGPKAWPRNDMHLIELFGFP